MHAMTSPPAPLPLETPLSEVPAEDKKRHVRRLQALLEVHRLLDGWPELAAMYRIVGKIGEGTFSSVYKAVDRNADPAPPRGGYVAVKSIFPTSSESRIVNEVQLLAELRGHPNVANLVALHRKDDKIVVIMPYCEHLDVKEYFAELPISDLRYYFASLFSALDFCHSKNIIHRDVKPGNFLYHPTRRHGVLVDFGLAQKANKRSSSAPLVIQKSSALGKRKDRDLSNLEHASSHTVPEFSMGRARPGIVENDTRRSIDANRAGTRGFRAPEVLIKVQNQTTAIDVWSAGVTLLCFLTRKFPFFQSSDDVEALQELCILFGSRAMKRFAADHQRILLSSVPTIHREGTSWRDLLYSLNPEEFPDVPTELFDFLGKVLELDPAKRIAAKDALKHPWLRGIRPR